MWRFLRKGGGSAEQSTPNLDEETATSVVDAVAGMTTCAVHAPDTVQGFPTAEHHDKPSMGAAALQNLEVLPKY